MTKQVSARGLEWYQDSKFGMFIHWGLYSILGRGEWVMFNERIPVPDYEPLMRECNPRRFDADEWVRLASDAGQKYVVITSRHHDGFSMYDTRLSDYKVTRTPFGRDPLRELAEVCARREDVKLGFYVSLLDWHHPAYRFRREGGLAWSDYLEFLHGQVRELCTQFGEIACIWFDGDWPNENLEGEKEYFKPGGSFEYEKLYDMIHTLQPDAVILNNRHATPLSGEDVQGFEQDLPGENKFGFNKAAPSGLPLEVCMTLNDHWGYHREDDNHKSTRWLVHKLVRAASQGANYLLNVGPTPDGEILPAQAERLRRVGAWLAQHGKAIYRTRAGVIPPTADGMTVSTRQGDMHYVHVLDYVSDWVRLTQVPQNVTRATLVKDGSPVDLVWNDSSLVLKLAPDQRGPIDTVVELT